MLFTAGILEICWVISMKYSAGFTKLVPSVITIITMIISFALLSHAFKTIPVGTAYAIWTGIGAAGAVIAGILLFNESATLLRFVYISMIISGIIGLKITS